MPRSPKKMPPAAPPDRRRQARERRTARANPVPANDAVHPKNAHRRIRRTPPAGKGKASCASQSSPANDAAQSEKRCPRCSAGSPPTGRGKQTTKVLNIRFLTFNGRTSRIDIRLRSTRHSGDRRAFPPAETDDSTVHGQEFDDLFLYLPKRTGNTKIGTVFVFVETTISNMPYENKPS